MDPAAFQARDHSASTGHFPIRSRWCRATSSTSRKTGSRQRMQDQLIRLAAFENPEFYRAQAMRLPTYAKPRLICCAEDIRTTSACRGVASTKCSPLLESWTSRRRSTMSAAPASRWTLPFTATSTRSRGRGRGDPGARHRRAAPPPPPSARRSSAPGSSPPGAEHTRARASPPTDGPMASSGSSPSSACRRIDRPDRRRAREPDRHASTSPSSSASSSKGVVDDLRGRLRACDRRRVPPPFRASVSNAFCATSEGTLSSSASPRLRRAEDGHHPIIFMQCGPIRYRDRREEARPQRARSTTWSCPEAPAFRDDRPTNASWESRPSTPLSPPTRPQRAYPRRRARRPCSQAAHRWSSPSAPSIVTRLAEQLAESLAHVLVILRRHGQQGAAGDRGALARHAGRRTTRGGRHRPVRRRRLRRRPPRHALPRHAGAWRGTLQQYAGRLHREHAGKAEVLIHDYVDEPCPCWRACIPKRLRAIARWATRLPGAIGRRAAGVEPLRCVGTYRIRKKSDRVGDRVARSWLFAGRNVVESDNVVGPAGLEPATGRL